MKCHKKLSWDFSLGNMSPENYQIIRRGSPLHLSPEAILEILVNFILDQFVPPPPLILGPDRKDYVIVETYIATALIYLPAGAVSVDDWGHLPRKLCPLDGPILSDY